MFKNKKGIILHPGTWIVSAFIIGAVVMYLIGTGVIPTPISFCK